MRPTVESIERFDRYYKITRARRGSAQHGCQNAFHRAAHGARPLVARLLSVAAGGTRPFSAIKLSQFRRQLTKQSGHPTLRSALACIRSLNAGT